MLTPGVTCFRSAAVLHWASQSFSLWKVQWMLTLHHLCLLTKTKFTSLERRALQDSFDSC